MSRIGYDRCYFVGMTYDDDPDQGLPWSEKIPAGTVSAEQRKLKIKLVEQLQKSAKRKLENRAHGLSEKAENVLNEQIDMLNGENPAKPTLRRKHLKMWKDRVGIRLGGHRPRMLCVGEYGEKGGRPHYHAIILDISEAQARICSECWPHGSVHYEPVREERIGTYVAKDIVKSTWSKNRYIAMNREAPFMSWPTGKGRGLATGQENEIYDALSTWQKSMTAEEFEYKLQTLHMARSYTKHVAPKHGPAVSDMGKTRGQHVNVRYGRTAYARALARIDRNPVAQEFAAKVVAQNAHLEVAHTQPGDRFYLEEHDEARKEKLERAERASTRAKRNHDKILERKRRGGTYVRRPSQKVLEAR